MIQTATHTLLESPASVPELCCSQCSVQVVAAADGERRRLERDIHDGAQQRLVSLALQLGRIGKRLDPESEVGRLLAAARAELAESLQELREIARGLHPAVLVDHGLGAALRALAARASATGSSSRCRTTARAERTPTADPGCQGSRSASPPSAEGCA